MCQYLKYIASRSKEEKQVEDKELQQINRKHAQIRHSQLLTEMTKRAQWSKQMIESSNRELYMPSGNGREQS